MDKQADEPPAGNTCVRIQAEYALIEFTVSRMIDRLKSMGLLRNLLHLTALVFALLMPFAKGPEYTDNWNLFFAGILPATGPIIVIIIGLDTMMSSIWKSDTEDPAEIARFQSIIRTHQLLGGFLLLSWMTVFLPDLV